MFHFFGDIYCINLDSQPERWESFVKHNAELIGREVKRFAAVDTQHLDNHHLGCALSHRRIIQEAKDRGLKNVLVLEDDALVNAEDLHTLERVEEIKDDFDLLYLGSFHWLTDVFDVVSKHVLRVKDGMMSTHAVCYPEKSYDQILDQFPDDLDLLIAQEEAGEFVAIDGFLKAQWQDKGKEVYLLWPRPIGGNAIDKEENRPKNKF